MSKFRIGKYLTHISLPRSLASGDTVSLQNYDFCTLLIWGWEFPELKCGIPVQRHLLGSSSVCIVD